jgi:type I restriction enzyme M protein
MIASLNTEGVCGVVMPHGVLFRGGSEQAIRKGILEKDLVEAVIGLPTNLFYGAGIPAAILIINKKKPKDRKGKVLFINAELEFEEGKNQNKLRQQDIEKILASFDEYKAVKRYAKVVDLEEIKENDFNLNIRRYADTSPPSETFDVKGVLNGGIPKIELKEDYIQELIGEVDLKKIFTDKDKEYFVFKNDIDSKEKIRERLGDASAEAVMQFERWWDKYAKPLRSIEKECLEAEKMMNTYLKGLGYE